MGYSIIRQDNNITYNLKELVCDTKADIKKLPTKFAAGSFALCLEDCEVYVLNTKGQWQMLSPDGASSGGTTDPDADIHIYATKTDIDNMF